MFRILHDKSRRGHGGAVAALAAVCTSLIATAVTAESINGDGPAGGVNYVNNRPARSGPLANTAVANARIVVPDGSSVSQTVANSPETHWFVVPVESAKSYVIEVINTDADLGANAIQAVGLFDLDGTTAPPETRFNCDVVSSIAPAFEVSADGVRCVLRTYIPASTTLQNKRGVFVKVDTNFGPAYQVRARESTIYGRWTTNGYDFHVELQNTTSDSFCAQIHFMPGLGTTPPIGPNTIFSPEVIVPPQGAIKIVRANGVTSGGDLRGTLRITACGSVVSPPATNQNFVPGALHVSTYAFNPATSQYLYFFPWQLNNGTANSW